MLNEPTKIKLYAMRLAAMAAAWAGANRAIRRSGRSASMSALPYSLMRSIWPGDNRRLNRLLKGRAASDPERVHRRCRSLRCSRDRKSRRSRSSQPALGSANHINVLISGKTGVGKSYMGCSLGTASHVGVAIA